jgi:hypothetical protein
MTDTERCILQNQLEIMSALALIVRYAMPVLVGKGDELDMQQNKLLQRHKETETALWPRPTHDQR